MTNENAVTQNATSTSNGLELKEFKFNNRAIKLSAESRVNKLLELVTDTSQLEYLDSEGKVTEDLENAESIKRKQQVIQVPTVTINDVLEADQAKSMFILNSLLDASIFGLVRDKFDKAINGNLGQWAVTIDELVSHLTPAESASGAKVTKKAIKEVAASFAAWLSAQGKKPKAVELQLELAANGFAVSAMMGYSPAMVEAIASNFVTYADTYEGAEGDALELMTDNLNLALANNEDIGADDL